MNLLQLIFAVLAVCLTLLGCNATSPIASAIKNKKVAFNAGSHFRNEIRGENGDVEGEYGYRTPDGCLHIVRYQANGEKYRVLGTKKRECGKGVRPNALPRRVTTKRPPSKFVSRKVENTTTKRPGKTQRISTNRPGTTQRTTTSRPETTRRTTTNRPETTQRTTTKPQTTTTKQLTKRPTTRPKLRNSGKQLAEPVGPPPNMKRPSILSPDDPDPIYSFGYEAPGHGHVQAGLPDGTKKGEFFFDSPDGWRRFVTYEATPDGFFPRMRNIRIPDWENSPLNPKNQFRKNPTAKGKKDENQKNGVASIETGDGEGKQLNPISPPSNGCPYYFYSNTKINFHWERCLLNGTRVGQYGKLADDGYEHRVAYFADERGYHPKITRTPLTTKQEQAVADFTQGAFIIPNIEEEKQETERRIQEWIEQNQGRIEVPL